jgi:hypothetical protein
VLAVTKKEGAEQKTNIFYLLIGEVNKLLCLALCLDSRLLFVITTGY